MTSAGRHDSWRGLLTVGKTGLGQPEQVPASEAGAYDHKGIELYRQYQHRLRELNAADFGDLLLHVVTIFQTHSEVLVQYQRFFRYILVDEYQDTNVAQYLWLAAFGAGASKYLLCRR